MHRRTVSQAPASSPEDVEVALHTHVGVHRWATTARMLCFDATPGSPWLLVPPAVRCAFDALASAGIPLADTAFGPPMLGVKCGCNDAFVVSLDASGDTSSDGDDAVAAIHTSCAHAGRTPPSGRVERSLLRPVVRGQTLGRWMRCDTADGRGRQAGAQTAVEPARADAVRTTVLDGRVGATNALPVGDGGVASKNGSSGRTRTAASSARGPSRHCRHTRQAGWVAGGTSWLPGATRVASCPGGPCSAPRVHRQCARAWSGQISDGRHERR